VHQKEVIRLMYAKDYNTRVWSEIKKSGKSMLGGAIGIA
jgi:hypothetical protein